MTAAPDTLEQGRELGWAYAVERAVVEFSDGDLISHDWIDRHLGTVRDGTAEAAWARFGEVQRFKRAMLRRHQILVRNVRGDGYRLVPAREQRESADTLAARRHAQASRDHIEELRNVRVELLSPEEQRALESSRARAAAVDAFMRRRLPAPADDQPVNELE